MSRTKFAILITALVIVVVGAIPLASACANPTPAPSPTPSASPSPSPSPSVKPSPTPSASPTPAGPTAAEFYKGKNIIFTVGHAVGDDMDLVARILAPSLKQHLGAASVVVVNKPEAGGIASWNYIYSEAKKDGTEIAVMRGFEATNAYVSKNAAMRFKPDEFTYIGFGFPRKWLYVTVSEVGPYRTINDLMAAKALKSAVATPFGTYYSVMMTTAAALGLDIKIAAGVDGGTRVVTITNKQIDASVFSRDYIMRNQEPGKRLIPVLVTREKRNPEFPDAVTLREIAPANLSEDMKALIRYSETALMAGNVYIAPPGIPADRAALLTEAFLKALRDNLPEVTKAAAEEFTEKDLLTPETFLAEMKENVKAGEKIQELILQLFEKYKA